MIRLKFQKDGQGDGRSSLTVMMVQQYDENHRLEVTPQRPPHFLPDYFLIWSSCVIKEGQPLTSVSGQQSGAAPCRRRVNFPPGPRVYFPQCAKLRCRSSSCSFSCRRFLSVCRWRIYAAGSQPGGVRGANRQLFGG